jgi:hypothetical protein
MPDAPNWIVPIALYAAALSTIQLIMNIWEKRINIRISLIMECKELKVHSGDDFTTRYWRIIVTNRGQRTVIIDSFWFTLLYDDKEHDFFPAAIRKTTFEHNEGTIEFPYELEPQDNFSIPLSINYFDSFFWDDKSGEFIYPRNGFRIIAYFKDKLGKPHKSTPFMIC